MDNKKGTTVLLTVIGIATLLVALVGATFAYFTASVTPTENSDPNVTITAASLGTVTFDQGTAISLLDAYPNATDEKAFSLTGGEGSVDYDYKVYMDIVTNQFTDANSAETGKTNIQYQFCVKTNDAACSAPTDDAWTRIATGTTDTPITLLDNGVLKPEATDSYVLWVRLLETGAAQDDDQGRTFVGKIRVEIEGLDVTTGFTTDANGQVVTTQVSTTAAQ